MLNIATGGFQSLSTSPCAEYPTDDVEIFYNTSVKYFVMLTL